MESGGAYTSIQPSLPSAAEGSGGEGRGGGKASGRHIARTATDDAASSTSGAAVAIVAPPPADDDAADPAPASSSSFIIDIADASSNRVLKFEANQDENTIRFRGRPFWSADLPAQDYTVPVPEGYLANEAKFLITEDGRFNAERLVELVGGLDGSYKDGADFVAASANLDRPRVQFHLGQTELFLQLYVFQCVNALFFCFNPVSSVAGSNVSSGFGCSRLVTTEADRGVEKVDAPFTCAPDGAVAANQKSFVLAAMELNNDSTGWLNGDDMFNCVLLTSMAAVALVERGVADKVLVPFVVNVGEVAYLFAAYKEKGVQPPVIQRLAVARFYLRTQRVEFVALLAVLLHKLTTLMGSEKGQALTDSIGQIPDQSSGPPSRRRRSSEGGGERPRSKKQNDASTQASKLSRSRTSTERRQEEAGSGGETVIGAVAECEGRLEGLMMYKKEGGSSPFYFIGEQRPVPSNGLSAVLATASGPVFVKVWREGDYRTSLEAVKSEIELLGQAHRCGVPCPRILSGLTGLSVTCKGNVYHRLVMHRLANHRIERNDLQLYAYGLVAAVHQLHRAGILHCDIKPSNVVWDAVSKTASLVDFGHAQKEAGATAYRGTDGYTSPEVEQRREPHSRRSDAYSVGRTIRTVLDDRSGGSAAGARPAAAFADRLGRVAKLLARTNPDDRISLEDALEMLKPSRSSGRR
jgi:Protein kinase domain